MKVAYVIDSLDQGGAERSVVELAPALVEQGVRLAIVTRRPGGALVADARATGATVIELGTPRRWPTVAALRDLFAQHRPDLVHTAVLEANLAGRVAASWSGLPLLSSITNTPYGPDHLAEPGLSVAKVRAAQALDAATAQLVWRFHAPAEHVAEIMAPRLGIPRDRIVVIPRARDVGRLGAVTADRRATVRRTLGIADDAPVVLALSRHEHLKGLDVLVDAAVRLRTRRPATTVLVAGREGEASGSLRGAIADAGLDGSFRLLGHRDDVGALLAAADLLVVPSRREGLPGAVLEAMAVGLPVVATDLPGCREALGDDLGIIVPTDDPDALAAGIERVLTEPVAAGDPGAAQARVRERYTPQAVAPRTLELWARTIAEGPPAGTARAAAALRQAVPTR